MSQTNNNNKQDNNNNEGSRIVHDPQVVEHKVDKHVEEVQPVVHKNVEQTHVHKKVEHSYGDKEVEPTQVHDTVHEGGDGNVEDLQNKNKSMMQRIKEKLQN